VRQHIAFAKNEIDRPFVRLGQKQKAAMEYVYDDMCDIVVKVSQQHVSHLRTFFHLEQILVTNVYGCLVGVRRIIHNDQGFSFYFNSVARAGHLVECIRRAVPIKTRCDSIPSEIKYHFFVEIVPIFCGDLIFLPPDVAATLGANIGPIVICTRVAQTFTLLDPFTLTHCFLDADQYWNAPFTHSFTRTQLVKYVVLDIVLQEDDGDEKEEEEIAAAAKKYRLADAVVARVEDFGNNDTTFQIKTHLGHILKSGDYALGYDLSGAKGGGVANTNTDDVPAAILITKSSYDEENGRIVVVEDKWESDYQLFLKDLQQDTRLTFRAAAMHRNQTYHPPSGEAIREHFIIRPSVPLEELQDQKI
jgi:nonsense-mediated mRNA decay protein 3